MRKNLVKEALKYKFFNDKDAVINDYMAKECEGGTQVLNYTNGKVAIANFHTHRVYTRNGYFFSVILKDEYYLNEQNEEELLEYLDNQFASKYEEEEEPEEGYEDVEDVEEEDLGDE